jgi:serine/threonine protein kinase
LTELVSLWQRRRATGEAATPAELCRQRPELLSELERRIAVLERMSDLANGAQQITTPHTPDDPHTPFSKAGVWPEIPGYEILCELGQGGMGVVYKARQKALGRIVALKLIRGGAYARDEELSRFRAEAAATARLQHANIVQIHETGEYNGLPFFSLEFCDGGSLDRKLAGTPLLPDEAARMVRTLAAAVQAAHQRNIVHRDLKPANVLLLADGTAKIGDFGLAKIMGESGQTASSAILGTPSYMAPEQAKGDRE